MHENGCAHNFATINLADGLVTEANTEKREFSLVSLNQFKADPGLIGRAGAGREHDGFCLRIEDLVDRNLVVPVHLASGAELAEIVNQIIGEAVVIIDKYEHVGVKE